MKRYIAFLRGVNINGKNKVPMTELKKGFEEIGFTEVRTYLNSGNVIFSSDEGDMEVCLIPHLIDTGNEWYHLSRKSGGKIMTQTYSIEFKEEAAKEGIRLWFRTKRPAYRQLCLKLAV